MEQITLRRQIEGIHWNEFPQPEWNGTRSVADALTCMAHACDSESCGAASDKVLSALGNNHAGTYYPVLLGALPVLEFLMRGDSPWPQRAALCLVDDLFASFSPESGYETVNLNGEAVDTETAFRSGIRALAPLIECLADGDGPNARLASELLAQLRNREIQAILGQMADRPAIQPL